nr:MAG TPA: hypothetical protein [Caudoviricetes sp.]DAV29599.1 MAG TPA: hypothetical protein [Caudoviricetes sp.]
MSQREPRHPRYHLRHYWPADRNCFADYCSRAGLSW